MNRHPGHAYCGRRAGELQRAALLMFLLLHRHLDFDHWGGFDTGHP